MISYHERLIKYGKLTIPETELQQLINEPDYRQFYHVVEKLVEAGALVPVKSSRDNGRRPPPF